MRTTGAATLSSVIHAMSRNALAWKRPAMRTSEITADTSTLERLDFVPLDGGKVLVVVVATGVRLVKPPFAANGVPLIADGASRFLLACRALRSGCTSETKPFFERVGAHAPGGLDRE